MDERYDKDVFTEHKRSPRKQVIFGFYNIHRAGLYPKINLWNTQFAVKRSYGFHRKGILTDKYYADKASGEFKVAEEVADSVASVIGIIDSVYDAHSMQPENARLNNVELYNHVIMNGGCHILINNLLIPFIILNDLADKKFHCNCNFKTK